MGRAVVFVGVRLLAASAAPAGAAAPSLKARSRR